jgi:phosphonate metabolism transcriptional regulator PhnF
MLDKANGIPYYRQIAQDLARQIRQGAFSAQERLPSESDLSTYYGVNRHTVRQAIAELINAGLVYRLKGKGTYPVRGAERQIQYKVSSRTCFTRNIMELGHSPAARILKAVEMPPSPEVVTELNLDQNQRVVVLEILRSVDNEPFSVATSYLPSHLVPGLLNFLEGFTSLYHLLEKHYHLRPIRARSALRAVLPTADDAAVLEISPNVPVLQVKSTMLTEGGVVIEYCVSRFRGDRSCLQVDFSRDQEVRK